MEYKHRERLLGKEQKHKESVFPRFRVTASVSRHQFLLFFERKPNDFPQFFQLSNARVTTVRRMNWRCSFSVASAEKMGPKGSQLLSYDSLLPTGKNSPQVRKESTE